MQKTATHKSSPVQRTSVVHLSVILQEELDERGWTIRDLALRMGGDWNEVGHNQLALEMYFEVHDKSIIIGKVLAKGLSKAFGVSPQLFINADEAWRKHAE